jgi:hypothetical protein
MNKKIIIGSSDTAFAFQKLSGFVRNDELSEHNQFINTYFLLHENDSKNIKDALKISHKYPGSVIYCILIDEQLGAKLKATIPNFNYFIPSMLVSEKFVEAIKSALPQIIKNLVLTRFNYLKNSRQKLLSWCVDIDWDFHKFTTTDKPSEYLNIRWGGFLAASVLPLTSMKAQIQLGVWEKEKELREKTREFEEMRKEFYEYKKYQLEE